jgi:hypothetical protein
MCIEKAGKNESLGTIILMFPNASSMHQQKGRKWKIEIPLELLS